MLCSSRLLTKASMKPRTLTLAETLAGAERAHKRVMRWPMWKRELSGIGTEGMMEKDDEKEERDDPMSWTRFITPTAKLHPPCIFIELPRDEAVKIFETRFSGRASDSSIGTDSTLELVTAYDRECEFDSEGYDLQTGFSLVEFEADKNVLILRTQDLKETP